MRNPFKLSPPTARARIAAHAKRQASHHELEALRLRYEIALLRAQADNHDSLAEVYSLQAKGHAS